MKPTVEKLSDDVVTVEDVVRPQNGGNLPDTHCPAPCGCLSCGGRAVPADDLETRRKIERYRNKRHG